MLESRAAYESSGRHTDFDQFLHGLITDMPKVAKVHPASINLEAMDPLEVAQMRLKEQAESRKAAAKARAALVDKELAEASSQENQWRQQVQMRKEAERQLRQAKLLELENERELKKQLCEEHAKDEQDAPGLPQARRKWAEESKKRHQERTEQSASQQAAQQSWLDDEWGPQFALQRERLRQKRRAKEIEEEERRVAQTNDELTSVARENLAMMDEDAAAARFVSAAEAACLVCSASLTPEIVAQAEAVRKQHLQRQQQLCQAAREEKKQEEERREQEYRSWKRQVAVTHRSCREDTQTCNTKEVRKNDSHEEWLNKAAKHVSVLRDKGLCPRSVLEDARIRAEQEKRRREEAEPAKIEQELWDALLAKNRLKQKQEREVRRTPRWGLSRD